MNILYEYEGLEDLRRLKAFIPHLNFSKLCYMDGCFIFLLTKASIYSVLRTGEHQVSI